MNKDEVEANEIYNSIQKRQAILVELEKLRPNSKSFYIGFACMFSLAAFYIWLYPEIPQHPVSFLVVILTFGIGAVLNREIQRIDSRIDALYRLLKDDFNKTQ
jgi:hypothetical protein